MESPSRQGASRGVRTTAAAAQFAVCNCFGRSPFQVRLSVERREALAGVDLTRDGLVRLRPNAGLTIKRDGCVLDTSLVVGVLHEVVLTERALRDGARLAGTLPRALLLVENLGPYLDLCAPEGWLVAHVPGWDTVTVRLLMEQMPSVH